MNNGYMELGLAIVQKAIEDYSDYKAYGYLKGGGYVSLEDKSPELMEWFFGSYLCGLIVKWDKSALISITNKLASYKKQELLAKEK